MSGIESPNKLKSVVTGALRSTASSFPVAASIATAWSEYNSYKLEERVAEFVENSTKRLNDQESQIIGLSDAINKIPDVAEVMERCIEASIREVNSDKRKVFSNAYCCFLENPSKTTVEERINIIHQLEQLTLTDLNLLLKFARSRGSISGDMLTNSMHGAELPLLAGTGPEIERIQKMNPEDYFIEQHSEKMHSITKLESRGLISEAERQRMYSATGNASSYANKFRYRAWRCTPMGYKLLENIINK